MSLTPHKEQLRNYFDGTGFERWNAIYGDQPLSRVRRTIRTGHTAMLDLAQNWLCELLGTTDAHILDAGCGTGLFTVALAQLGFRVTAIDLAPQMAHATQQAALAAGVSQRVTCIAGDLEQVEGRFDAVVCFDVLIHYPRSEFARMCAVLTARAERAVLLTHAPYEPLLALLHWVGGHFPGAHRRTNIQLVPEATVRAALAAQHMPVQRAAQVRSGFYHVNLVAGVRES